MWSGTLYWLIWWLALVCAAIPAWELVRFIVHNGPIHFHHTQSCSAHDAFRIFVLVYFDTLLSICYDKVIPICVLFFVSVFLPTKLVILSFGR